MDEKHVADYFIISGVSEEAEFDTESKQLISTVLPITDITVIFRGLGELCPPDYKCIETTPGGHLADLNNGNFKSPNIQICYRRGNDKPPLVDVGVFHEDKERVLPDVEVVYKTPYGRCASTGNSSPKFGTFITYRRAKTNYPYNQLVVVDLCVILNNKSEHPPHAFYSIKKNLNKSIYGMIGSEVFLCYKKTLLRPPSLCYTPQIISRFPLQDYADFPLPDTVPLFCLPTGANIELWPANTPLPRPTSSTFVLTSDSAQKIYGFALTFYEPFDESHLNVEQKIALGLKEPMNNGDDNQSKNEKANNIQLSETYAIKSICILSRWPFFDCFEKFLMFLHRLVFSSNISPTHQIEKNQVPLEHYISHLLLDVSFPTSKRPTVIVQLTPGTDETVTISQPSSILPLPLTGASFCQLLSILGVENTMNVLLFGLSEQKILLHSLRPFVLTGVAEAISAMFFPFHWQCPYVPLCPLSLHGILNAPLPFIVGIDSRCFDTFAPPDDIICIDLDTKSIFLSELKKSLNLRILPKRAARVLKSSLEKIFQKLVRVSQQAFGTNQSPQHRSPTAEANRQVLEKNFEIEIQEAFVRFMATILSGFRTYLLPITSAPTVGATDPTSLFDFDGFLMSRDGNYHQFYQLITRTQMFTHYIEERSFVSDKDTSLAFFDDCEEKLTSSENIFSDHPIKLFDKDDSLIQTDRSVYIPAPEQSPSVSTNNSFNSGEQLQSTIRDRKIRFGPLNPALFHRHPQMNNSLPTLEKSKQNETTDLTFIDKKILFDNHSNEPNSSFSISRRTKQEVRASQKLAKKSFESPLDWSKYLVSCCHSLWFSALPSYIAYCKLMDKSESDSNLESSESGSSASTPKILGYAYSTLVRLQRLRLTTDEICFRVLTLLCGHHGQPDLAVKVFLEMREAGIKPNAVTYGYYNKTVLESKWPDEVTRTQDYTGSVEYLADNDNISSDETKSNRVSESTQDQSEGYTGRDDDDLSSLRNLESTPNFKLTSLINDASNLQWSRWTSSRNSKSVYKGIKNAATGIVSSLQEMKSSFSMSNNNTPSKLLTSAHQYTSSATKDMLSQWANSMFATPAKEGGVGGYEESGDDSSIESNELIKFDDEENEDVDPTANEASDFRDYQQLFQALGDYHSNSSSRENLVDHISNLDQIERDKKSIAIIIRLTTSSRCNACHSLLSDEVIMERWSPNESNLNTKCIYCGAKIVPFMKIVLEDRRFATTELSSSRGVSKEESNSKTNITYDNDLLIDITSDETEKKEIQNNQVVVTDKESLKEINNLSINDEPPKSDLIYNNHHHQQHNFTVPYLSPIVLRKELESVYESSGDSCLASSHFVDDHPIVFWNLLWYFNQINVPTHLALLCLSAKSILNGRKIPANWTKADKVVVLNQSRIVQDQRSIDLSACSKKSLQRRHSLA